MKSYTNSNNIFILIILCGLTMWIYTTYESRIEGFGPRWLRTRKNKMMRHIRRGFKPYYDDYFKSMERFRRKWL